MRIVSLLPSATESVCALGLRNALVGRSHECDHPEGLDDIPVVTASWHDADALPHDIDRPVAERARGALSPYRVDGALLRELEPDLVITQDLCKVCAVSPDDVQVALAELTGRAPDLLTLRPMTLRDTMQDILRIGEACGASRAARAVLLTLESRIRAVHELVAGAPVRDVITVEWFSPIMLGGLWTPELVRLANGRPLLVRDGVKAPTVSLETLRTVAPDVVLLKPCGLTLPGVLAGARAFVEQFPEHWPAVAERSVWATDGNAYFNRPGPRLVDSLEILAACMHPERFPVPSTAAAVRVSLA